jgi:hypothetical protein
LDKTLYPRIKDVNVNPSSQWICLVSQIAPNLMQTTETMNHD